MRRVLSLVLTFLTAASLLAQQRAAPVVSPLGPAGTGGIAIVDRALAKLATHRRVLVVGAHPDDEDTTLLSYVAAGLGGEAAYLSLSRGEGGQNLLGPELGIGLGLIRTGELLAARGIDGGRQYFTRAFDFGYTRSLQETFERWPRETLREDAVRVVRRFKPQVVVAVFPGDSQAGHGQHQAAGLIAEDLFELAGEPDRYPGLSEEGLPPWQPEILFRRVWWNPEEATLEFPLGSVEPFSGNSLLQIAAASRSMHRSQDMGTLQSLGSRSGGLAWVAGEAGRGASELFGGVDTRLSAIARLLPTGRRREAVAAELDRIADRIIAVRRTLSPVALAAVVPVIAEGAKALADLVAQVRGDGHDPSALVVADLLEEKLGVAGVALAAAAGVAMDAVTERETVNVGGSLEVTAILWNSGPHPVTVENVEVLSADGWRTISKMRLEEDAPEAGVDRWRFGIEVPSDASSTLPYFLRDPLVEDLYDWKQIGPSLRGEPLQAAPVMVRFDLSIAGVPLQLEREAVYRHRDQAVGEVRRPLRSVPRLEVTMQPSRVLWPLQDKGHRDLEVLLQSNSDEPVDLRLELCSNSTWPALPVREVRLDEPRGRKIIRLRLEPPSAVVADRIELTARAETDAAGVFDAAYPVVSYPHIRPMPMRVAAKVNIQMLDLELPPLSAVGYIRGASDRVPEVLQEVGIRLRMLTADDLRSADLSGYDAIIVGSRAYETDPSLAEANSRMLQYVEGGGLLVVQYQQYQYVSGGYAPFFFEIDRPHGRVTDEASAVRILEPQSPVFHRPNRITERDWQGWVQERGLYFASSWGAAFTPLLGMQDPEQKEESGALLVARVGRGTYVYTGLSFFRQLPAGVPGALRLFANLLALADS